MSSALDILAMHLPPQGVMVVWEWEMSKEQEIYPDFDHVSEASSEDLAAFNPEMEFVTQMLAPP